MNRFKPILQRISKLHYIILYNIFKIIKKQDSKQVLFLSDSHDTLTGNFSFISLELKKYDYKLEYFLKKNLKEKKTFKEKIKLCKLIAESKYILVDDFYPIIYALKLKKNTELIQVWHALGAFKSVGYRRKGKENERSITHKNYTSIIVSSENIKKDYAEAFGISIDKVHSLGIPRTDIFFDKNYKNKITKEILKKYPILKNKKVILFAPTFRGNDITDGYYDFNLINFEKIKRSLDDSYVFLIKMHPFIKNIECLPKNDNFFINITDEKEINSYLFITDTLITDYSSVIFENALLENKVIFYVPDIDEYISKRDFFYDFSKYTYGDVAKNMDELIKSIKNPHIDMKKLKEFKNYFVSSCDGNATKRVVEELIVKR